jgi:hypothetical protein
MVSGTKHASFKPLLFYKKEVFLSKKVFDIDCMKKTSLESERFKIITYYEFFAQKRENFVIFNCIININ